MNNTVRTPTLAELKAANYTVDITHNRVSKVAYNDPASGKIVVSTVIGRHNCKDNDGYAIIELLPKGGVTEVTVKDTASGLSFFAAARCRDDENYDKKTGVNKCLDRIAGLMLVIEWKNEDNFKSRLQC